MWLYWGAAACCARAFCRPQICQRPGESSVLVLLNVPSTHTSAPPHLTPRLPNPTPPLPSPPQSVGESQLWQRLNTAVQLFSPRYPIFDLEDGKAYRFRVTALNRYGPSEPSEPSDFIQKRDPHGKVDQFHGHPYFHCTGDMFAVFVTGFGNLLNHCFNVLIC